MTGTPDNTAVERREATGTPDETREAWDNIAAGYDAFVTPTHISLASQGLARLGLRPGTRFLDVAAGSGALSIPAARLGARVLSTDVSPRMLERLAARAREEGLDLETRVMDGHALELEDDAFDAAGSQFGVMLFPDLPRALREMARVTRPGGRVLMHVFGPPREVEFFQFFVRAVQSVVPSFTGPPMDPPPLPFQVADPDKFRREMTDAGLKHVDIETVTESLEFQSGQQLWDWLTGSNPIVGSVLDQLDLTADQRASVRRALEAMVRERAGGDGLAVLTNPVHIGIGTS